MADDIAIRVRRSQLGRVRGAGSAQSGSDHWYAERITALALLPLTLWFVFSMIRLAGASHDTVLIWASRPWNTVFFLALIVMTFKHMALGLRVVLEDYVHQKWFMTAGILAVNAACWVFGLAAVISVLKLAFW